MNKRLITTITAVLLVATGCGGGNADDQFNRNAEKLTAKIAERRDGRVSVSVSPDVVISELRRFFLRT